MGRAREIADLIGGTTPDIILKTSDGAILNLQTSDTTVTADSVLGAINFQAPDEASGTDAILIGSKIEAIAEGTFSASSNVTSLVFSTASSAAAGTVSGKMTFTSGGNLIIKDTDTADGSSPTITLQSGDTDIAADDVLGTINFQAPDEGTGTDAILVAAGIEAVSEGDFSSSSNATKLVFKTGSSAAADSKLEIASDGSISTPTAGTNNLRIGANAGNSLASGGNQNVLIGDEAGTALVTGDDNTCVGFNAGKALTGEGNVAIGSNALASGDTEANHVAIGKNALKLLNIGGNSNVAIGLNALSANVSGGDNVAVGVNALAAQNHDSTASNTRNTAVGASSGLSLTTGTENTFVGANSADALTQGAGNVAVGYNSLGGETVGSRSIAIGHAALVTQNFTTATNAFNIAIGYSAGAANQTGVQHTIIGGEAGDAITTGDKQTLVGYRAGGAYTTGTDNVHVGRDSGLSNIDCSFNTSVGGRTLEGDNGGQNCAFGFGAGLNCTGINNTFIGLNAAGEATSGDNLTALGRDAGRSGSPGGQMTTLDNQIALGDENVGSLSCQVSLTATSDERDKTDFKDLDLGLDFVNALKPVTYVWDKRTNYVDKTDTDWRKKLDLDNITSDGSKKDDDLQVGFKAQDVIALEDAAGYKLSDKTNLTATITTDGKQYGLRYERFVPMLVKAIQELSAKVTALESG